MAIVDLGMTRRMFLAGPGVSLTATDDRSRMRVALSDDILGLRDRVLADLTAAHDYYADTKTAWQVVHGAIAAGSQFIVRNQATGTVSDQAEFAARARGYVAEQLGAQGDFPAISRDLRGLLLRPAPPLAHRLPAEPRQEDGRFQDHSRPAGQGRDHRSGRWERAERGPLRPTGRVVRLSRREGEARLPDRRGDRADRGGQSHAAFRPRVHNEGIANRTYVSKAGKLARSREGDRLPIPEHYHPGRTPGS